jgi:hemolysin D
MTSAEAKIVASRPRAFRRDELEFLPAALEIIETPASPAGRAIAGAVIAFLCIALGWSVVGRVDIIATAPGRVIPVGKTKVIQPFETGVVRAIRVRDGASVARDDVLVEIDPTANEADETRLNRGLAQDRLDVARLTALLAGDPDGSCHPKASAKR